MLDGLINESAVLNLSGQTGELLSVLSVASRILNIESRKDRLNRKLDALLTSLYAFRELHLCVQMISGPLKLVCVLVHPSLDNLFLLLVHSSFFTRVILGGPSGENNILT
jgi:hypothetical protein